MNASVDVKGAAGRIYRALLPDQIRVLTISPSSIPDEKIRCTLETISLNDRPSPSYRALSYTWGNQEDTVEIVVNERSFQATRNLHAGLELFRSAQNPIPTLWVDAICINQKDVRERLEQVQLMRKIFSQARETWIWLGPEADASSKAINLIKELSSVYLESCKPGGTGRENADRTRWGSLESRGIDEGLVALDSLFARDYWYRVWVVQEIAVSKEIVIFCGKHYCSWNSVLFTAYFLDPQVQAMAIIRTHRRKKGIIRSVSGDTRGIQPGIQRIMSIQSVRNDLQGTGGSEGKWRDSLLLVLLNHRFTHATDPKDKYIALAGLVQEDIAEIVASLPNLYDDTVKVQDVYAFAVHALAFQSITTQHHIRALDFLDCAGEPRMKGLFSWVPDWSVTKRRAIPLLYWQIAAERHPELIQINAPGHISPSENLTFSIRREKGSLLARGFVVGSISEVNSGRASLDETPNRQGISGLKNERSEYPTHESLADVVWKTLVLDHAHADGRKAPSNWGDIFYSYIARPSSSSSPSSIHEQWFQQNKHFKVCGATLEELARERRASMSSQLHIDDDALAHFKTAFTIAVGHRKLATTGNGYLCLVPLNTKPGDSVEILADCSAPVLLRKMEDVYEFIGTCYVHGIMHGEAVIGLDSGDPFSTEFDIR